MVGWYTHTYIINVVAKSRKIKYFRDFCLINRNEHYGVIKLYMRVSLKKFQLQWVCKIGLADMSKINASPFAGIDDLMVYLSKTRAENKAPSFSCTHLSHYAQHDRLIYLRKQEKNIIECNGLNPLLLYPSWIQWFLIKGGSGELILSKYYIHIKHWKMLIGLCRKHNWIKLNNSLPTYIVM